jgi:phosphohistidine swiveling domain-containing protein
MLRSMGHAEAIRPEDEIAPKPRLPLAAIPDIARIVWQHTHPEAVIRAHQRRTAAVLQRLRADDPQQLDDVDLWASIDRWNGEAVEFLQPVLLLGNVLFHEQRVQKACAAVGHSADSLIYPHLAAGERSVSAQQAFDLVALAELARRDAPTAAYLREERTDLAAARRVLAGTPFLAALERFLAAYGHRGRYEYDWSLPRYVEDAAPIFQAIKGHLDAPPAEAPPSSMAPDAAAAAAWAAFVARLSRWQRWTLAAAVRRALTRVKQYYVWRERVRSDLARVVSHVRARHVVLAERFARRGWIAAPGDYFMLHLHEVAEVIAGTRAPASLPAIVAARAAEQHRQRQVRLPYLLRESQLPALIRCAHVTAGTDGEDVLTGHAVSPGSVEAEVVVVRDPADFGRMRRGAILVAPATDPSWTPLFTLASGVIVEIGGVLSHASTIAREYGLPAVANVRQATRRLRTGDRVRLDADAGVVQRLTPASAGNGGRS